MATEPNLMDQFDALTRDEPSEPNLMDQFDSITNNAPEPNLMDQFDAISPTTQTNATVNSQPKSELDRLLSLPAPQDYVRFDEVNPISDPSGLPGTDSFGAALTRSISNRVNSNFLDQAGQMTLGTLGGWALPATVAAVAEPGPIGEIVLAGVGAYFGGGAGDQIQAAFDPYKERGLGPANRAGLSEAGAEVGGRTLFKLGGKLLAPFIKRPTKEALSVGKEFIESGGQLLPSQMDDRALLQLAETVARGGALESKAFKIFEEAQEKRAILFAKELVDDMLPSPRTSITELGDEFFNEISRTVGKGRGMGGSKGRKIAQLSDTTAPMYQKVDELSPSKRVAPNLGSALKGEPQSGVRGVGPSTSKLNEYARKWLADDKAAGGGLLSPAGKSTLESIVKMDERVEFQLMQKMRSKWLKQGRQLTKDMDTSDVIIKDLAGLADDAMMKEELNPNLTSDARRILEEANAIYREGSEIIERNFGRELAERLDRNPELLLRELIPEPGKRSEGAIKRVRELKKAITTNIGTGKPDIEGQYLWDRIGQTWVGAVIDDATAGGVINPKQIGTLTNRMGEQAITELAGERGLKVLRKAEDLGTLLTRRSATSSLLVRTGQGAGMVMLWRGSGFGEKDTDWMSITKGGALVLGPRALARLLMSSGGQKVLTAGIKAKRRTSELGPIAVRMIKLLQESEASDRRASQIATRNQSELDRVLEKQRTRTIKPKPPRYRGPSRNF